MSEQIIRALMDSGNFITVNRIAIRTIGLSAAVLLGEFISQYNYWSRRKELTNDDEFYCIRERLIFNSGLTEGAIKKHTKRLIDSGLISVIKKGLPARNFYQLNFDKISGIFEGKIPSQGEFNPSGEGENDLTGEGESTTTIYNKNINNKNKERDTGSVNRTMNNDSDESLSDKKFSLKNSTSKRKSPKQINNYIRSKMLTDKALKYLLNKIKLKSPNVKEKSYFGDAEVLCSRELVDKFVYGFKSIPTSMRAWVNKQPNKVELIEKLKAGFGKSFYHLLTVASDCYDGQHFPDDKKYLPNRLSGFLYNPGGKVINSYFLLYAFNPPKEKANDIVTPEKQKSEGGYTILKKCLAVIYGSFTNSQTFKLSRNCNLIYGYWKEKSKIVLDNIERSKLMDAKSKIGNDEAFFDTFVEWLYSRADFIKTTFGGEIDINMLKPGTKTWTAFIDWLNKQYGINMEMGKEDIKYFSSAVIQDDSIVMPWETGSDFEIEYEMLSIPERSNCRKYCKSLTGTQDEIKTDIQEFFTSRCNILQYKFS